MFEDYDYDDDDYSIYDMSEFMSEFDTKKSDSDKAYRVGEKLGLGTTCQIWDESEMYQPKIKKEGITK